MTIARPLSIALAVVVLMLVTPATALAASPEASSITHAVAPAGPTGQDWGWE